MPVELRHMALDRLGVLMVALGLLLAGCNTTPVSEPLVEEEIEITPTIPDPVPAIEPPRFRIELPNGAVLEWSGAASVGPVADLVERMARLP